MIAKKQITNEIAELTTLQALSRAYAEIAALRMKKARDFVLKNREFLRDINKIFQEVLASYRQEVEKLVKKAAKGANITFLAHNGKTAAVLLSANTGLYGEIVSATYRLFMEEYKKGNVEATIIGKLGLSLFLSENSNAPYTYFDFPDNEVREDLLSDIISHLVNYEEIHIYYGKFENVVSQVPSKYNISAEVIEMEPEEKRPPARRAYGPEGKKKEQKYLFEPSLETILGFFETQIFASLMDQSIRESQLAKFASRIKAMTTAGENISKSLKKMEFDRLRLTHGLANKKQLNSLAGITMKS